MTGEHSKINLPPNWAEDPLSEFIQASFQNALATFVQKKGAFNLLSKVDEIFCGVAKHLDNIENPITPAFFHRSHSSYLASCRLSMSGQTAETFSQLRIALEYALYALHMDEQPLLTGIWIRRHDSEESIRKVRSKFSNSSVLKTLEIRDLDLKETISVLYQRAIDFGGHPNERAVSSTSDMVEEGGSVAIKVHKLSGDSDSLDHALKSTAQIGLGCILIFQLMFAPQFEKSGVLDKIRYLKNAL